jgi:hypothetical protein
MDLNPHLPGLASGYNNGIDTEEVHISLELFMIRKACE